MQTLEPERVIKAMRRLEEQADDPRTVIPVGDAIASMLGVECTPALFNLVKDEAIRTVYLARTHYAEFINPTPEIIAGLGLMQGITLAKAVREVELEQDPEAEMTPELRDAIMETLEVGMEAWDEERVGLAAGHFKQGLEQVAEHFHIPFS